MREWPSSRERHRWERYRQQVFYCVSLMGWEWAWCVHGHWYLHRVRLRYTDRHFNGVGLTDWNLDFNWIGTIDKYFKRDVHWHFNGVRFRYRDFPLNVHRVWSLYWNFHADGVRYRYFHLNWVGTFDRDGYFNWDSFHNGDRSVYDNWVGMVYRDFDLDGIGFRDGKWDLNGVWLRFRDGNRDFYRVGMIKRHWDFHRDRSVNWDSDFHGDGIMDRIRYLNLYRMYDTIWVRLRDFNSFFDYLLLPEAA